MDNCEDTALKADRNSGVRTSTDGPAVGGADPSSFDDTASYRHRKVSGRQNPKSGSPKGEQTDD